MKPRLSRCLCWLLAIVSVTVNVSSAGMPKASWVGTWAASLTALQPPLTTDLTTAYSNVTIRNVVHVSLAGRRARVTLSNEFGVAPLTIGGVHVALSNHPGSITAESDRTATFGNKDFVRIPAGAVAVSDPISLMVPATSDVVVSIYIPAGGTADHLSYHAYASSTNYIADGNALSAGSLDGAKQISSWILLKNIEVEADSKASALVALGDSITDGVHSTADKNARWPDILSERLHADERTSDIGVLNAGISGNRMLTDANPLVGQNALARFDRDVLGQSGVKYLVILEGINDIGRAMKPATPYDSATDAAGLIWGLEQLAAKAHAHGLKVFAATLTPYSGFTYYYSAQGEEMRQTVNKFIRTSDVFDAVIDFDKVIRDSGNPDIVRAAYDSGDHLHPNDAGYKAMANAIDLALFTGQTSSGRRP
jgi:lysophospholipase L1-like esterase